MKVVAPKAFTYKGGNKAVLLLHGFTGNTSDVRRLGKYLQQRGYTCHAPLYTGHGLDPSQLIKTGPDDWWQDVVKGYHFLQTEGYEEIAVAGVSLGAIFSLKLGTELPVKGIVSMSATVKERNIDDLFVRVRDYANGYWKMEGKDAEEITSELVTLEDKQMPSLTHLRQLIMNMGTKVDQITSPIFVLQGLLDKPLYIESAQIIYNNVGTDSKLLKWYEQSDHIITLGKEREQVYEDIHQFLNSLDW